MKNLISILLVLIIPGNLFCQENESKAYHAIVAVKVMDSLLAHKNYNYEQRLADGKFFQDTLEESLEAKAILIYGDKVENYNCGVNGTLTFKLYENEIIYSLIIYYKGYKKKVVEIDTRDTGKSLGLTIGFKIDLVKGKDRGAGLL